MSQELDTREILKFRRRFKKSRQGNFRVFFQSRQGEFSFFFQSRQGEFRFFFWDGDFLKHGGWNLKHGGPKSKAPRALDFEKQYKNKCFWTNI